MESQTLLYIGKEFRFFGNQMKFFIFLTVCLEGTYQLMSGCHYFDFPNGHFFVVVEKLQFSMRKETWCEKGIFYWKLIIAGVGCSHDWQPYVEVSATNWDTIPIRSSALIKVFVNVSLHGHYLHQFLVQMQIRGAGSWSSELCGLWSLSVAEESRAKAGVVFFISHLLSFTNRRCHAE